MIKASTSMPDKSRVSKRMTIRDSDDEGAIDDDDDEIEVVDDSAKVDLTYLNNPMGKDSDKRLKALAKELSDVGTNYLNGIIHLQGAAEAVEEAAGDDEESAGIISSLDQDVRDLIDQYYQANLCRQAVEDIRERIMNGEEVTRALEDYKKAVEEGLETYKKRSARSKYASRKEYVTFRATIWKARHVGQPMPSIKSFLPRAEGAGESEEDDDDLEIDAAATQQLKCPLTMIYMTEPMKNPRCKHRIEKSAAKEYFGNITKACPQAGCSLNSISKC